MSDNRFEDDGFFSSPKGFQDRRTCGSDSLWTKVPSTADAVSYEIAHFLPHLSKRMRRVISELEIETVGELAQTDEKALLARGAGALGVLEIKIGILDPIGLSLPSSK